MRQHRLRYKVTRIFSIFSPQMRPNQRRVISNFIVQAPNHALIAIEGDKPQSRSLGYAAFLIEEHLRLRESGESFTILDPAHSGNNMTNSRSRVTTMALPTDNPRQRRPDSMVPSTKLKRRPATPLAEVLRRALDYFDRLLSEAHGASAAGGGANVAA